MKKYIIKTVIASFFIAGVSLTNFQTQSVQLSNNTTLQSNIAKARIDPDANCYWTYSRKFLSNNIRFIACSDCSSHRADRIADPGTCGYVFIK